MSYKDLPYEMKLAIGKSITDWRDFLNFRHINKAHMQLTENASTLASRPVILPPRILLMTAAEIEGPNSIWIQLLLAYGYTVPAYALRESRSLGEDRRAARWFPFTEEQSNYQEGVWTRSMESLILGVCRKLGDRLAPHCVRANLTPDEIRALRTMGLNPASTITEISSRLDTLSQIMQELHSQRPICYTRLALLLRSLTSICEVIVWRNGSQFDVRADFPGLTDTPLNLFIASILLPIIARVCMGLDDDEAGLRALSEDQGLLTGATEIGLYANRSILRNWELMTRDFVPFMEGMLRLRGFITDARTDANLPQLLMF